MKSALLGLLGDGMLAATLAVVLAATALAAFVVLRAVERIGRRYRETFTESASASMADMFLFVDPQRLFYAYVLVVLAASIGSWFAFRDPLTSVVVLVAALALPQLAYRTARRRRLKRFEQQLPDGLLMIAGAMRAGASLNVALESLVKEQPAPLSQEFELFLREQRVGVDFDQSLTNMESRLPLDDFAMLTSALRISREVGGNLAEVLESLADTLRRKQMMEGKIESLTAQGKLQGIVMTALPVLLAVLLYMLEPEAMSKLWTTTVGYVVLAVVILMLAAGYFMIRKITSIDV